MATLVIARWNGELDRERLRAVLDDPSLVEDDMELHHGSGPAEEAPGPEGRDSAVPEQRTAADGADTAADSTRREPARSLTNVRVATIRSGGSGFLSQSRLGTPLMAAITVSLSPKTSLT